MSSKEIERWWYQLGNSIETGGIGRNIRWAFKMLDYVIFTLTDVRHYPDVI